MQNFVTNTKSILLKAFGIIKNSIKTSTVDITIDLIDELEKCKDDFNSAPKRIDFLQKNGCYLPTKNII